MPLQILTRDVRVQLWSPRYLFRDSGVFVHVCLKPHVNGMQVQLPQPDRTPAKHQLHGHSKPAPTAIEPASTKANPREYPATPTQAKAPAIPAGNSKSPLISKHIRQQRMRAALQKTTQKHETIPIEASTASTHAHAISYETKQKCKQRE